MIPLFITGDYIFKKSDDFSKVSNNGELSNKMDTIGHLEEGEYIYNLENQQIYIMTPKGLKKIIIEEDRVLDIHYSRIFNKVNGKWIGGIKLMHRPVCITKIILTTETQVISPVSVQFKYDCVNELCINVCGYIDVTSINNNQTKILGINTCKGLCIYIYTRSVSVPCNIVTVEILPVTNGQYTVNLGFKCPRVSLYGPGGRGGNSINNTQAILLGGAGGGGGSGYILLNQPLNSGVTYNYSYSPDTVFGSYTATRGQNGGDTSGTKSGGNGGNGKSGGGGGGARGGTTPGLGGLGGQSILGGSGGRGGDGSPVAVAVEIGGTGGGGAGSGNLDGNVSAGGNNGITGSTGGSGGGGGGNGGSKIVVTNFATGGGGGGPGGGNGGESIENTPGNGSCATSVIGGGGGGTPYTVNFGRLPGIGGSGGVGMIIITYIN